jgi:hypothetical protein
MKLQAGAEMKVALFLLMAGAMLSDTIELKTGEKIE